MRSTLLLLTLLALPSVAWGSGLGSPMVGSGWSSAVTADPSAVWWNPAMLSRLDAATLLGSASFTYLHVGFERERLATYQHADGFRIAGPLDEADLDRGKTGVDESVSADQPLGTFSAFFGMPLGETVAIGAGIYVPYGAILSLPSDGPQRWALQDATILTFYVTPAISVRITDWMSIGAGASLVVGALSMNKVVDLAGTDLIGGALAKPPISQPNDFGTAAAPYVRELDILGRPVTIADAYGVTGTFNIGLAFHPTPWLDLGLVYSHGAVLEYRGTFTLDMDDDFFTTDLAKQGLSYPALVEGDAWVELPFPASLRFGVGFKPDPAWVVRTSIEWVMYSAVESIDVTIQSPDLAQPALGIPDVAQISLPRRWNDTVQIEVLAATTLPTDVTLGVKLGYHSPMSPDSTTDVGSPDGQRIIASLLTDLPVTDGLRLQLQADIQATLPREVRGSDYDLANGTYDLLLLNLGGALVWTP